MQDVGAEDAVVGVQLVDHHPAQVAPHLLPGLVESQEPGVQHVRRGDQDVRRLAADAVTHVAFGVAVVDLGGEAAGHGRQQAPQLVELVLLQGLEGGICRGRSPRGGAGDRRGRRRCRPGSCPRPWAWPPRRHALPAGGRCPPPGGSTTASTPAAASDPADTLAEVGAAAGVARRPRRQGLAVDDAVGEGGLFEVAQVGGEGSPRRRGDPPGGGFFRAGAGEVLGG